MLDWNYTQKTACCEQIQEVISYKTTAVRPLTSHLINHPSKKQNIVGSAGEVRTNPPTTFSCGLLHMDTPVLANEQRLTFISAVRTKDADWRNCQE